MSKATQLVALLIALCTLTISNVSLAAGDPAEGKKKAAVCASCHGANGISPTEIWPNLAGQKATYLANQIKAFRDGIRKDPSMTAMVANLSDQDAEDIAAYYASLK